MMADEKPKNWSLEFPRPKWDKSDWEVPGRAKPIDPMLVIEAARAIRANPKIWSIFATVKPDEWISRDDGVRISEFVQSYFESSGRPDVIMLDGMDVGLLRSHLAGSPKSLESDAELLFWLKRRHGHRILGGE